MAERLGVEMIKSFAESFVQYVHEDLAQIKAPHFDIAARLAEAKRLNYADELGYKDIYELSEVEFGFKRSSTAAYIAVAEEYGVRINSVEAPGRWSQFSFSQLVEMLPLDDYDRGLIKPEMTVKQIREWRQNHKFVVLEDGDCVMYGELSEKQRREYADYKERQKAECGAGKSEIDDFVQTSGQEKCNMADANLQDFEKDVVVQSAKAVAKSVLLGLKNRQQREEFVNSYKDWGVWLSVPELNLTCYKYKFANGHEIVVSVYSAYVDYGIHQCREELRRYHVIDDKRTFFDLTGVPLTYVLNYMTEFAKEI